MQTPTRLLLHFRPSLFGLEMFCFSSRPMRFGLLTPFLPALPVLDLRGHILLQRLELLRSLLRLLLVGHTSIRAMLREVPKRDSYSGHMPNYPKFLDDTELIAYFNQKESLKYSIAVTSPKRIAGTKIRPKLPHQISVIPLYSTAPMDPSENCPNMSELLCQAALFFVDYQLSYLSLEALLFKVGLSSGKMLGNQWLRVP